MSPIGDQVTVTPTNLSALVSICTIVCLLLSIFSVAGRIFTKNTVVRKLTADDYIILGATGLCIGQSVAICLTSTFGLGRPWEGLGTERRAALQQALYASELLFILTVVLVKISITVFLWGLAPMKPSRRVGEGLSVLLLLWTVASVFAFAFQCEPPTVWRISGNTCVAIRALHISFDVINILTEGVLIAWPMAIIVKLHTSKKRRVMFMAAFASRIFVIIACATQLAYGVRVAWAGDLSFSLWKMVICQQVVQSLSLTTACAPYIRPFLLNLESGFLWGEDFQQKNVQSYADGSRQAATQSSKSIAPSSKHLWKHREASGNGSVAGTSPSRTIDSQDIAMLPMPSVGQPFKGQSSAEWDNRCEAIPAGLPGEVTTVPVTVDTRRGELEGY